MDDPADGRVDGAADRREDSRSTAGPFVWNRPGEHTSFAIHRLAVKMPCPPPRCRESTMFGCRSPPRTALRSKARLLSPVSGPPEHLDATSRDGFFDAPGTPLLARPPRQLHDRIVRRRSAEGRHRSARAQSGVAARALRDRRLAGLIDRIKSRSTPKMRTPHLLSVGRRFADPAHSRPADLLSHPAAAAGVPWAHFRRGLPASSRYSRLIQFSQTHASGDNAEH